jgi:large subunit ribosomal protein L32e
MTEREPLAAKNMLRARRRGKAKKPEFARPESWRYMRLKENWRRPRGMDNKVRKSIKGWPPPVSIGYRGPKVARGLHPSGYKDVLVYNPDNLSEIDSRTQIIRIAHTVGKRKRARIIIEARKKKITILNLKEAKEALVGEEEKKLKEAELEQEEKESAKEEDKAEPEAEEPKKEKRAKKRRGRKEKQ